LTAQGYPFPAPTGIVDYQLRKVEDTLVLSLIAGIGNYGGPFVEADAKVPIVRGRLGIAAGASYSLDEYSDGSDARVASFALVPRWRPAEGVELLAFWSLTASRDEEVAPLIIPAGPYLPPRLVRRRYYGQPWANADENATNQGLATRVRLGSDWQLAAAVFHSVRDVPADHTELFVGTLPDGATREVVIADPPQRRASTSGEASVSWAASEGDRSHRLRLRLQARAQEGRVGGSSEGLDLGPRRLGIPEPVPEPSFSFGPQSQDRVRQVTAGIAYEGRWPGVGELVMGLQRADYRKTFLLPDGQRPMTEARPWLMNAALALFATDQLAAYAGYTRGLEESGVAPGNAANRNQALPSIMTRQLDAGLRYALTDHLRLVAGVFDVRKPNFTTDEQNVFTELGEVRHQGIEISFAGELVHGLNLVSGAVFMRPRVSGAAVRAGRIGDEPVGQTERSVRLNFNYRLPVPEGVSIDLGVLHTAARVASSDNRVYAPALTTLNLGTRYHFSLFGKPMRLRVQMTNVTNAYGWGVLGNGVFAATSPRAASANLAVDL
jgi:iron complex outermembrane receptor protein